MAAVGTVAAGIVHNLKNPLTGILGFAELIKYKYPDIKEIATVYNSAVLMNEMIENILSKSRQKRNVEAIDVCELLRRELDFLKEDREFKTRTQVAVSLGERLPEIWYAYTDLSQILGNLLRNAAEAMYGREEQKLHLSAHASDDNIVIRVSDSGCGIDPDQMNKLFDPFYTTKTGDGVSEPKGTGLGLYTVAQMLETYGASITVESDLDVGTTFQVSLPINKPKPDSEQLSA